MACSIFGDHGIPQLNRIKLANCIGRVEKSRPGAMETPLIARTYKLPPRTVACIETLAKESGMTQGGVLAAVAKVLAEPEPKRGIFK